MAVTNVHSRSTDSCTPAFRALLSVAKPALHEQLDGQTDHTGLHSPVRRSSPSIQRSVGDCHDVPNGDSRSDHRVDRAREKGGNFSNSPRRGERGFLLSLLPCSQENGRDETDTRSLRFQQTHHEKTFSHVDDKTCVGVCASRGLVHIRLRTIRHKCHLTTKASNRLKVCI